MQAGAPALAVALTAPRCPVKGCPARWHDGPDRLCPEHQLDAQEADWLERAGDLGLTSKPDGRGRQPAEKPVEVDAPLRKGEGKIGGRVVGATGTIGGMPH